LIFIWVIAFRCVRCAVVGYLSDVYGKELKPRKKSKRPLHNYMAKEKIEKICQIELKIEGNNQLLARFLAKSW